MIIIRNYRLTVRGDHREFTDVVNFEEIRKVSKELHAKVLEEPALPHSVKGIQYTPSVLTLYED